MIPKINDIKFEKIDIQGVIQKLDIQKEMEEFKDHIVVPTYFVTLKISNWPSNLISVFKYVLWKLLPSKRFVLNKDTCKSNDKYFLVEKLDQLIRSVCISSDCPIGKFSLYFQHDSYSESFTYINTHHISLERDNIKKYVNKVNLTPISIGCYIQAEGEIVYNDSITSDNPLMNRINSTFKRNITEEIKSQITYCSGEIEFNYHDNYDPKKIVQDTIDYMKNYFIDIKENLSNYLVIIGNNYLLKLKYDRSGYIANLLHLYSNQFYYDKNILGFKSSCITNDATYESQTKYEFAPNIEKNIVLILEKIISDINSL